MVTISVWFEWLSSKGIDVGQYLKKCRKDMGLSQKELEDLLPIGKQSISNWETKARTPSPENLRAFDEVYRERMGVSIFEEYIVDFTKNRPKPDYREGEGAKTYAAEPHIAYKNDEINRLKREIEYWKNENKHLSEMLGVKDQLIQVLEERLQQYKEGK